MGAGERIKQSGEIVVSNAFDAAAIRKAQTAFAGAAEALGISGKDAIQTLVDKCAMERNGKMRILADTNFTCILQ